VPQSSSVVECQLPAVYIPSQLQPLLDTDSYTPSEPYGTLSALPSNETRTCLLASVTSAPANSDRQQLPEIKFGIEFDGLRDYIDYGKLTLYAPPRLCFNDTFLTYDVVVEEPVYIEVWLIIGLYLH